MTNGLFNLLTLRRCNLLLKSLKKYIITSIALIAVEILPIFFGRLQRKAGTWIAEKARAICFKKN